MGKPAARIGDVHPRGPIVQGSADVIIGGSGAARVGDRARCGSGYDQIQEGESSVLINGRPASRVGDRHSCGAVITSGCGSVLIGKDHGHCLKSAAQSASAFVTDWE